MFSIWHFSDGRRLVFLCFCFEEHLTCFPTINIRLSVHWFINKDQNVCVSVCVWGSEHKPAVHHHGSGVRRVAGFHPAQERQERCGMFGNAVIRPGGELELSYLSLLAGAVLNATHQTCEISAEGFRDALETDFSQVYLVKSERPDAVCGQLHRVQQRDLNESVCFCSSVGPVLITLHLHNNTHITVQMLRCQRENEPSFRRLRDKSQGFC